MKRLNDEKIIWKGDYIVSKIYSEKTMWKTNYIMRKQDKRG